MLTKNSNNYYTGSRHRVTQNRANNKDNYELIVKQADTILVEICRFHKEHGTAVEYSILRRISNARSNKMV